MEVFRAKMDLPPNAYPGSLHAKPDRGRVKESREKERKQENAWTAGSVGLQAKMHLCCFV